MTARRHRSRRLAPACIIVMVLGLVAASCGGGDDDADTGATENTGTDETVTGGGDDTGGTASGTDGGGESTAGQGDDTDTGDGTPVKETLPPEQNVEPVFGGTLRYGLEADVNGLNPSASSLSAPGLMMGSAVFDTLAASTADGGWVPYLAESFTPSEDLTSWTMKLRGGISFHDGTPLDADAAIANFEAQRNHPLVGLAVKPFFPETGAIEKVDDLTVTFHLLDAHANFPTYVTGQLGMIASPAWLQAAVDDPTLNQEPVGTGPFVFESRSEDSVTRFVRNENWWGGDVYLDAVEFYPVPDPADRVDLLFAGELDALQTTDQQSILDLRDDDTIDNVLDDTGEESFALLNAEKPPFDDIRARKALTLATPRQNYLDLIGLGVSRPADGRFIPESPYHNPAVKQEADDPDAAAALAAEYCAEQGDQTNETLGGPTCTDGKINIELQWAGPSVVGTRIAELLDEGWSSSFNVTYDELAQDEHISQTAFGQYNVSMWRQFGADDPSADNVWLLCRTIGGISLNWPRYCDPARDEALLAAQATADEAQRATLYQQAEQMIHDAYTYVFLTHTMWDNAFVDTVHGVCDRTGPDGTKLKCASNGQTWFSSVWID